MLSIKSNSILGWFACIISAVFLSSCSTIFSTPTPTPTSTPTPVYTITPLVIQNLQPDTPQPVPRATLVESRIYPTPVVVPTFVVIEVTVTPGPLCVGSCSYITVNNDTGGMLTLNINGPKSVTMEIPVGVQTIPVPPGSYSMQVNASCGSTSDTFSLGPRQTESVRYYCTTVP